MLRDLTRINGDERALFDDLRDNRLGRQVRLEQERIQFGWIEEALANLQRKFEEANNTHPPVRPDYS